MKMIGIEHTDQDVDRTRALSSYHWRYRNVGTHFGSKERNLTVSNKDEFGNTDRSAEVLALDAKSVSKIGMKIIFTTLLFFIE